jgi:hypothetical protein
LVRVITPWTASYTPALAVRRGEPLTFKGTDPDNPGWRWAENADGLGGWLPIDLIDDDHLTQDFHSTELTVEVGTELAVIQRLNGWSLCETEDGVTGWVPDTSLDHASAP